MSNARAAKPPATDAAVAEPQRVPRATVAAATPKPNGTAASPRCLAVPVLVDEPGATTARDRADACVRPAAAARWWHAPDAAEPALSPAPPAAYTKDCF